jgi:hypothetical protein
LHTGRDHLFARARPVVLFGATRWARRKRAPRDLQFREIANRTGPSFRAGLVRGPLWAREVVPQEARPETGCALRGIAHRTGPSFRAGTARGPLWAREVVPQEAASRSHLRAAGRRCRPRARRRRIADAKHIGERSVHGGRRRRGAPHGASGGADGWGGAGRNRMAAFADAATKSRRGGGGRWGGGGRREAKGSGRHARGVTPEASCFRPHASGPKRHASPRGRPPRSRLKRRAPRPTP